MRIKEIILQANSLMEVKNFYVDTLELPLLESSAQKVSVTVGESILTFIHSIDHESPYYHFAFNMTEYKVAHALHWLKDKNIEINRINDHDIIHSQSWNADSIYFNDPVGNIVELIARHNLQEDDQGGLFTQLDIKNISEVGLPFVDVKQAMMLLTEKYGIEVYKDSNEVFAALGDENGLFILSGLSRNWLSSNKVVKAFPLTVHIVNNDNSSEELINQYMIREIP
ncbi:VOC family protein [Paenibacillus sp. OV219]|uniref:VOC family protein n=1 Tax=Paenibacillus sp. OV219 TaxID=1884377 RepID=UPI0008AA9E95|nr:hypothetical protein [Paenibacillus sp. OV219]SEO95191.1 Catechol-2,3-dioxygenase [Paenibacillus sp. OV219]